MEIKPQQGPQHAFLTTPADIAIFGGAAGGGKTRALLMEPLRFFTNPEYRAVIFRRTTPQIRNPGGMWDESAELYPLVGAKPREAGLEWVWPSGAIVKFAHLEHETDKHSWQGSQLVMIGFDELTHFTESQFWFLMHRARSTSGIKPYIRATCNPNPDSFVHKLVAWWIDPATGLPIPERSGRLRYFVRRENEMIWGDSPEDCLKRAPEFYPEDVRSLTFIAATVRDNPALLERNPSYLANLKALPLVDRERYLYGNWRIRPSAGNVFRREWIEIVDALPNDMRVVRYWDRAASKQQRKTGDPDYTAGLKLGRSQEGNFYIAHVYNERGTPLEVRQAIKAIASQDGLEVRIGLEQDPAQAGVAEMDFLIRYLAGYPVAPYPVRTDKVTRAKPASAQAEQGNLKMLRGPWNEVVLDQLENFPEGAHDDIVDALSGAMLMLTTGAEPRIRSLA
jgi:predicted phage terminase large subunit-like protein